MAQIWCQMFALQKQHKRFKISSIQDESIKKSTFTATNISKFSEATVTKVWKKRPTRTRMINQEREKTLWILPGCVTRLLCYIANSLPLKQLHDKKICGAEKLSQQIRKYLCLHLPIIYPQQKESDRMRKTKAVNKNLQGTLMCISISRKCQELKTVLVTILFSWSNVLAQLLALYYQR